MGGYSQTPNQGQPPAFRRGLLQALLGLGTGGTDTDPENRIEDDRTRSPYGEPQAESSVGQSPTQRPVQGSTSDLEDRAAAGRLTLAEQMRMGGTGEGQALGAAPDHLQDLQSQYDRLNPTPQPMSTKGKLLRGLLGAATGFLGGRATVDKIQQQQNFEQNQNREKSQNLLSQIEAERRMQEQERAGTQRMTMQQDMENQREREREAAQERLFSQQNQLEGTREAARQATLKQQMDEQNQRQQAQFQQQQEQQSRQFGEQEKLEGMRESAAEQRAQRAAGLKDQVTTTKRYETAMDADQRLGRMEAAYGKATKGDQQAMLSMLADHIGMTLGMQKGARITKDILNEAQQSQPWLAKIGAKFDDRGYLSGVTLGPDQMRQMLDLGYEARDRAVQGAYDDSQLYGVEPPKGAAAVFGKRQMGAKPALQGGGGGNTVRVQIPGHPPGTISADKLRDFQKKYPNAQVLQQ